MKAQRYLVTASKEIIKLMREQRFSGSVWMHVNKGKKYPYSSNRQRRYGVKK